MSWLNYNHLRYFWTVAREGSISRAARVLNLTQPTVSAQLKTFEDMLGQPLFERSGRRRALTEVGRIVYRYAEEIFTLDRELSDTLEGLPTGRPPRFRVGVADSVPKLLTYRLLEPVLSLSTPVKLICVENTPARLVADLAVHEIDLVLLDTPAEHVSQVRVFNHLLGECDVTVFAAPALAGKAGRSFPRSLDGMPFLLPTEGAALRRSLERWFDEQKIRPVILGEFEDNAVLKVFGGKGAGFFAQPTAVAEDVLQQFGVRVVGRIESIRETFYAVTAERRIEHPAIKAVSSAARRTLFR